MIPAEPYIEHVYGDSAQRLSGASRGSLTAALETSIAWPIGGMGSNSIFNSSYVSARAQFQSDL